MNNDLSNTLSVLDTDDLSHLVYERPHLIFVLSADDLTSKSRRIILDGEAICGRSSVLEVHRDGPTSIVGVPDARMSSKHARITRFSGGYCVEDLGSKNGSLVNGKNVSQKCRLQDGDVLELGHSFFVFREPGPTWPGDDDDSQGLPNTPLQTLCGPLAILYQELARVAPSALPLLIQGETGVGKEVVARTVHTLSGRSGAFIPINCGALPENLVESELFGVMKGAYSGADTNRQGLVEAAQGGTLFLDEIGELPISAQAKLLRALQERAVTPIGGTKPVAVDFRLLTATNRHLSVLVEQKRFREDLFARITGFEVTAPPLRERREDLGLLMRHFIEARGTDLRHISMSRSLARGLMLYSWPYNVRELERAFELALILTRKNMLQSKDFALDFSSVTRMIPSKPLTLEDEERRHQLLGLLEEYDGNISEVARRMGKARMQIHRWFKRYGIDPKKSP